MHVGVHEFSTWHSLCYKYWTVEIAHILDETLQWLLCESLSALIESGKLEVTDYFTDDKDETKSTKVRK